MDNDEQLMIRMSLEDMTGVANSKKSLFSLVISVPVFPMVSMTNIWVQITSHMQIGIMKFAFASLSDS